VSLRRAALIPLIVLCALAAVSAGCDSANDGDDVVVSVAGTPIYESQLERAVEHARSEAEQTGRSFPAEDSREFRGARHAILEQLVLNVEIAKAANELHVAVPAAAVFERASEEGDEGEGEEDADRDEDAADAAFARRTVRAQLLYEAVARKVTAGANVRRTEVDAYYRARRAELEERAGSPARARLVAETILLRRRQQTIMQRWVAALQRRLRPRVHYTSGY
jgi:SurA N-terminal domain